jgi:hypothetical protein
MESSDMISNRQARAAGRWSAVLVGAAAAAYVGYVTTAWLQYGHARTAKPEEVDPLLDRFMPQYEVVDRHHIAMAAPADVVLTAAREMNLWQSPIIRAIFKGREVILRAAPEDRGDAHGLLVEMQSIGWRVLAEIPGREVVVGAVTQPWEPNVTFRPIPRDAFAMFAEPGYIKIIWTLRADPAGDNASIFRTETRATATDAAARAKFRRYWSVFSPGIRSIRWLLLAPLRAEAERRAEAASHRRVSAAGPQLRALWP